MKLSVGRLLIQLFLLRMIAGLKGKELKYYWEDEKLLFNPASLIEIKENKILINTVVPHNAPPFCMPVNKKDIHSWYLKDENLENDIIQERDMMNM